MTKERLILIGNGMAGVRTIEEILERDPERYDITIIGKEPYPNYNRIMLSNILQNTMESEDTIMNPYDWYEASGINLIVSEMVVAINRSEKNITTETGRILEYDKLIIATGSDAFILPIDGSRLDGVIGWRTIEDTERMISMSKTRKHAVVIGGGLLGLECARGLVDQGMEVTVVHLAEWLMETQLNRKAGELLQEDLEAQGIKFEIQANTQEILGDTHVEGVRLSDGRVLEAEMVVMAVGIRPVTKQARAAGLEIGRGIVVDDYMKTSDENIYAVGECVEHNSKVYGLVAPLYEQAVVLADVLTGRETKGYKGSQTFTSLKVSGCDLYSAGKIYETENIHGIEVFDSINRVYKKLFIEDNNIVGVVLYGDTSEGNRFFSMMKKSESIEDFTLISVMHSGETGGISLEDMDDDETICGCNGISKGTIVNAIREKGLTSVDEVVKATRAGNSCGKCLTEVEGLLEIALGDDFVANEPKGICDCTPLDRDEVVAEIRAKNLKTSKEVRHALDWKNKEGCPVCRPALNYYLNVIHPVNHEDEIASRYANERYHANIQKDGTFSVIPQMRGGVTNAEQLMKLGEVAIKYDVPMVKITGAQRVGLYGVKKEDLPNIWKDLGMRSASAYAKKTRSVKSCVGKEFCRFGTQYTTQLGIRLEKTFEYLDTPHKFKMGVSGCPRSCVESGVKDFGVIGVENGFQLFIGGNGGTEVVPAELLTTVETEDEVVEYCGALMQYYRETGIYHERTAPWVKRIGMDKIKEVIMDNTQRKVLYERIMYAKRALPEEPWKDAMEDEETRKLFEVEKI